MYMAKQYSLFDDARFRDDGPARRNKGMAKVEEHNPDWLTRSVAFVGHFVTPEMGGFIGEDIRELVSKHVGYPTHHNAWGTLVRQLLKLKLIEPTGELRAMRDPRSHARKTMVYRRTDGT
jgi:hypothetical protein